MITHGRGWRPTPRHRAAAVVAAAVFVLSSVILVGLIAPTFHERLFGPTDDRSPVALGDTTSDGVPPSTSALSRTATSAGPPTGSQSALPRPVSTTPQTPSLSPARPSVTPPHTPSVSTPANPPATAGNTSVTGRPIVGLAGKCVDDFESTTADGNPIILYTCTGSANQTWSLPGDGTIRVFGKCLDITGGATANGTLTELWTCSGGGNQQWAYRNGNLVNPQSGRCLDVPGADSTDGTQLEIWDCGNAKSNQTWTIQ